MADSKISALAAATVINDADQLPKNEAGTSKSLTAQLLRAYATGSLSAFSTATVAAGYAVDTYLQGSGITAPSAGAWKAGTIYRCRFDMVKTAAGTAQPTVTVRMGTLGTTADAAICQIAWNAGTAAADSGLIEIWSHFRTVGAGAAAVMVTLFSMVHLNAGLTPTGLALNPVISAGFDSTTQTKIGVSFNGGAAFSGTTSLIQAEVLNL